MQNSQQQPPDLQRQAQINDLIRVTGIGPSHAAKLVSKNITLIKLIAEWGHFITLHPDNSILMLDKLGEVSTTTGKSKKQVSEATIHKRRLKLLEAKLKDTKFLKYINHHQLVGLKYLADIEMRIPRYEIVEIEKVLKKFCNLVNSDLHITICGSYRRGNPDSGDIDVLISHPSILESSDMNQPYLRCLIHHLTECGFLIDHLTMVGNTKYMGICKLNTCGNSLGRRIDIRFVPWNSYAAAILYFTGSKDFNTNMRSIALSKGYTLNEYGIYKLVEQKVEGGKKGKNKRKKYVKGDRVFAKSEKDIFKILDMEYKQPTERNML